MIGYAIAMIILPGGELLFGRASDSQKKIAVAFGFFWLAVGIALRVTL